MASSILSCRVRHSLACGFARTCRRVVYYVARTRDNVACYIGGSGNNITDNISGAGDCVTYGVACVCNRILRGGASSISVSGNGSVLLLTAGREHGANKKHGEQNSCNSLFHIYHHNLSFVSFRTKLLFPYFFFLLFCQDSAVGIQKQKYIVLIARFCINIDEHLITVLIGAMKFPAILFALALCRNYGSF